MSENMKAIPVPEQKRRLMLSVLESNNMETVSNFFDRGLEHAEQYVKDWANVADTMFHIYQDLAEYFVLLGIEVEVKVSMMGKDLMVQRYGKDAKKELEKYLQEENDES